jgi:fermentation-respiration switch protein FrsA (DUF1100 family)
VAIERKDIAAVVMECPYADYGRAAMTHGSYMGMPGKWLQRPAIWLGQKMAGVDFSRLRPAELIPKIPCPLLVIRGGDDVFVPADDAREIEQAARARPAGLATVYWEVAGAGHVLALAVDPAAYRAKLGEFFDHALAREASSVSGPTENQPNR